MKIDLHMHSTASDGTSTPAQLAEECARLRAEVARLNKELKEAKR